MAVDDVERFLARRGQRVAQQAGEVALRVRAFGCFHLRREAGDLAVQALHLVEDLAPLGIAEISEPPHLAVERCVPVDAAPARIGLGQSQEIGMLARQARGDGGAQLSGGAPHRIAGQAERAVALQRLTDE